ncbi:tRNA (5-methylaminomethyl-2-thiouridine)(34)-methyltransferase MnmD [Maribacter chungangensis]|uniref:tRNA (5-methylaminomethyl-2-thiouridine)(34)-methyltransferase MnmD n=1 Tax=Maribacter chungangensis TaxID=1069117 RepID=A0ABW3B1B1_9FLAO
MEREIIITGDGSKTIQLKDWDEQYHSKHGAVQEAYHVFIRNGLDLFKNTSLDILEIGFGTALNAFITFLEAKKGGLLVNYCGVEAYPIVWEEANQLDYVTQLNALGKEPYFKQLHSAPWEIPIAIAPFFKLTKRKMDFKDVEDQELFDLIYFDAFGARVQPELWSVFIFKKMYEALRSKGYLVTYAAKGSVRRAMQEVGFIVERLPGPPGKREMLRAQKP